MSVLHFELIPIEAVKKIVKKQGLAALEAAQCPKKQPEKKIGRSARKVRKLEGAAR